VWPLKGSLPTPLYAKGTSDDPACDIWDNVYYAASAINLCFDIYQVAITRARPWDVLGFPDSFEYVPDGAGIYFNRSAVQKAINGPAN
jgi:carboxypeptidase D